jgi:hypothetical protein
MSPSQRQPRRMDNQVFQPKLSIRSLLPQAQSEGREVPEAVCLIDVACRPLNLIFIEIRKGKYLWIRIFDGTETLGGSWDAGRRLDCDLEMRSPGGGSEVRG